MRQRRASLFVAGAGLVLVAGQACRGGASPNGPPADDRPLAIVGTTIRPMTDPAQTDPRRVTGLRNYTVLVRSRHIVAVGPTDSVALPANVVRIDGRGRFVIPGLVDAHVHLPRETGAADLLRYLVNGVTTVRNMQGEPYHLRWRSEIASGTRLGPTLYTTGPFSDGLHSVEAARAFVHDTRESGYDVVKFHLPLPDSIYEAIIAAARMEGIPVVGHTPGRRLGVAAAVRARQATIEHAETIMQNDTDERTSSAADIARIVAELRGSGVCVTPTLVRFDHVIRRTTQPDALSALRRQFAWMRALVAALAEAGVPLVAGTDAPYSAAVAGVSLHEELQLLVGSGLSPYAALHAATADAARCLGHEGEFGVVHAGARGDLLLLASDPLLDITALDNPLGVVVRGRWLPADTLAKMSR
ncbi:MAG: amidohydrolase family protein [Gemmatimonadaceae bacterium]